VRFVKQVFPGDVDHDRTVTSVMMASPSLPSNREPGREPVVTGMAKARRLTRQRS
jgi:hypothetical protein